ncbi:MAG: arylesterase [Novosphingobium sp. 28-62-57]|uniref:arylesterase n=1 Tax=unclassified Novosphingobium TaxID=2644732 RepID=UPI000BD88DC6|nr:MULTISPECIES: arylesterase [unclassified Novosphingobium]OYW49639.1 MAG: arylesterase [Novosphingobium sp. 12-62-10]OYZ12404.1 MAG: arylesterase [Novosphingobium sp. 28-62-57]OZA34112.1 MAG: arylesterase [Novosphingobium sp. 17-62-9]HQS69542.1 arylesterase [Novosphingobium sp.]
MRTPLLLATLLLAACSTENAPDPKSSTAAETTAPAVPVPADAPVILAFGDSLYAGYNLQLGEGYPPRLEAALNASGTPARVINAGVSGDTSAAALQRLKFTLDNQPVKPSLALVGLGGNDMLRGLPPEQTRANLDAILTEFDNRQIPVVLTGMLAAPNLGADYTERFNPIWPDMAKKHKAGLVPFFLEPVLGNRALMLDDNVHPNAEGVNRIVAATQAKVAEALKQAVEGGR